MRQNEMTLPCGCVMWNENDQFIVQACPLGTNCTYVKYMIEETTRQHKPTEIRKT